MCGIAGFWSRRLLALDEAAERARAMVEALVHRGPDAGGTWAGASARGVVALGHRRLAIIDLSPEGGQPMTSASGRWVLVYNGEIYNHARLREELERAGKAPRWRGRSDTEVLLACVEAWGVRGALERSVGMFALALWDRERQELHLARDRLGIKPLYFARLSDGLAFASELGALERDAAFDRALDRAAIADVVGVGYVVAPRAIYAAARKLLPGTIATFAEPDRDAGAHAAYWSAAEVIRRGVERPFLGTEEDALVELERVLDEAVRLRMVADVPLGAFLSGGIDSSTVVALLQRASARPIHTFSIANESAAYDEGKHAAAVARHLGTDHQTLIVTEAEAWEVVPALPRIYDEPFADSSQIPTFLVSRLARREVTVALSGDGGDELFGGYNRHVWAPHLWSIARRIPALFRRAAAAAITAIPEGGWDRAHAALGPLGPSVRLPGMKAHKLARLLAAEGERDLYDRLRATWPGAPLTRAQAGAPVVEMDRTNGLGSWMMARDLVEYLPDDILTKVDRASMAVSLEVRVPILDHRVVEFAWSLPFQMKVRGLRGKYLLRRLLARYVPSALIERPKMGFGVPIGAWLRGPLRAWAEDLLAAPAEELELDAERVRAAFREHLERGGREQAIWPILMLCAWERAREERA
jgi:asparagine synthase (glutamine-hydrolysing)